jgi:two-component system chemotaxis response regulator CheY
MKVLVVDDDVVSRMVLMHMVDSCGEFEILEAEDGEHAWQQIEQGLRPAICFCDLRMPRLSGMELLERVKARSDMEGMPFVLVSSASDLDTVEQASDRGAAGYIVKPFVADQVKIHLAPFCAQPSGHQAEAPLATMQRLGINSDRLQAYLAGFQSQLRSAGADIDILLADGQLAAAHARLDRLHAGCTTLGLSGAAAAIGFCGAAILEAAAIQEVLADAIHAAAVQADLIKRLSSNA